jgi:hypothetical protein
MPFRTYPFNRILWQGHRGVASRRYHVIFEFENDSFWREAIILYAELGDITALACELLRAQDTLLSSKFVSSGVRALTSVRANRYHDLLCFHANLPFERITRPRWQRSIPSPWVRAWPRGGLGAGAPVEFWVGQCGGPGVGRKTHRWRPTRHRWFPGAARRLDPTRTPILGQPRQKLTTPSTPVSTLVDTLYAAGVTPVTPEHQGGRVYM